MGKTALTFAEIFIVLSLVFLIQTIANFNLYEGIAEQPPAEWIVLSLRQVPSADSQADHLKYLKLSGGGWERGIEFFAGRPDVSELTHYVDEDGICRTRAAPDPQSSDYWCLEPEFEKCSTLYRTSFLKLLESQLGIALSRIEVSGSQPEYVLSWKPEAIPEDATLTLGFEHCAIPRTIEGALKIDPKWKLERATLEYPHPLIISRTEYRHRIVEVPQEVHYVHQETLPDVLGNLAQRTFQGLVFRGDVQDCALPEQSRGSIRAFGYQEIALPLNGA